MGFSLRIKLHALGSRFTSCGTELFLELSSEPYATKAEPFQGPMLGFKKYFCQKIQQKIG
jgi:hypothetical protein